MKQLDKNTLIRKIKTESCSVIRENDSISGGIGGKTGNKYSFPV